MRENLQVSIIMPIYNTQLYVESSIQCILNQTYKNFELICIDDASVDNSLPIVKKFAAKDNRIKVLQNQKRLGAAKSRNLGIEIANSPYLLFLDADDLFEETLLEELVGTAVVSQADLIFLGYDKFTEESKVAWGKTPINDMIKKYTKHLFSLNEISYTKWLEIPQCTWNRMISRKLADRYQLRFQDLACANDVFFSVMATMLADKIIYTDAPINLLHGRNHDSPDRISSDRDPMCVYEALYEIRQSMLELQIWEEYCRHFWMYVLIRMTNGLIRCKTEARRREVYIFLQEEGMYRLGVLKDRMYETLAVEYRQGLEQFIQEPYSREYLMNGDFKRAIDYYYFSEQWKPVVDELRDDFEHVGVWGTGMYGNAFFLLCNSEGCFIQEVYDNDREKQGMLFHGKRIKSLEQKNSQITHIVIACKNHNEEIAEQIESFDKNITIIKLGE